MSLREDTWSFIREMSGDTTNAVCLLDQSSCNKISESMQTDLELSAFYFPMNRNYYLYCKFH